MTREEAINTVRNIYQTDKEKEALGVLIPELAESEDERIRKFFAELATDACGGPGQEYYEELGLNYDKVMNWLEKQEQKPITESKRLANEVIEYLTRCGYFPVLKDDSKKEHFHIDIPRHEDDFWHSEEYKHCCSVLGEYYMEGDYGGDTYTLYIWRAKKGQKPAEWSEEDNKRYISIGTTLETSAVLPKEDYDANMAWLRELVNAKKYRLCPSWKPSEEQMKALKNNAYGVYQNGDGPILRELYEQLKKL